MQTITFEGIKRAEYSRIFWPDRSYTKWYSIIIMIYAAHVRTRRVYPVRTDPESTFSLFLSDDGKARGTALRTLVFFLLFRQYDIQNMNLPHDSLRFGTHLYYIMKEGLILYIFMFTCVYCMCYFTGLLRTQSEYSQNFFFFFS